MSAITRTPAELRAAADRLDARAAAIDAGALVGRFDLAHLVSLRRIACQFRRQADLIENGHRP